MKKSVLSLMLANLFLICGCGASLVFVSDRDGWANVTVLEGAAGLGKVYENMMVDLMATSEKLVERSRRTVMTAAGVDYDAAARAIEAAGGSVKTAIVMIRLGCPRAEAERRLAAAGGFVRAALEERP